MNLSPAKTSVHLALAILAANLICASVLSWPANAEPVAAIYQQKCASCHGEDGQGRADGYDNPLYGDYSIDELADVIDRTMPEGEPEACDRDEARQLAEYIYSEFYSLEARQRKGLALAPRVQLTRLTVTQHRNAIADLLLHFTPDPESYQRPDRRRHRDKEQDKDPEEKDNEDTQPAEADPSSTAEP